MRLRVVGSVLVVVTGLVPIFVGGPLFALFMILLGVAGFREFLNLATSANPAGDASPARFGYAVVVALGCSALFDGTAYSLFAIAFLAVIFPLVSLFRAPAQPGGLFGWGVASAGSLYLGLPAFAAIATREISGNVDTQWLADAAQRFAIAWDPAPRGLAWTLTIVLAIWIADSAALFVGRAVGRRKLAPFISPNKSVEGALAGLAASMSIGALSLQVLGLGDWWFGLIAGATIGIAGQIGDLAESVLKRQAGVKDSGKLIPGHGGLLDRIDALLFAFPAGYLMAAGLERLGS